MNREEKQQQIEDFSKLFSNSKLLVVAESSGLTAQSVGGLRKKIRESGGTLRVFKNTFAIKALGDDTQEDFLKVLKGPNSFLFGGDNFVEDLKGLMDFAEDSQDVLAVKGGLLEGEYINPGKLKMLSTLPGKDELRAQLVGTLAAPMRSLVTALSGNVRNLVNVLKQIEESQTNSPE